MYERLEGIVAGDGHLRPGRVQAALILSSKYEEWTRHVGVLMEEAGLPIRYYRQPSGAYSFTTKSCVQLYMLRRRWYPTGRKMLPPDLHITPLLLKYWYLGDGSLKHRGGYHTVEIGMYYFLPSAVVGVARQLQNILGEVVRVHKHKAGVVLTVVHNGVKRCLEYMGESPVRCYDYKWDTTEHRETVRIGDLLQLDRPALHALDLAWAAHYGVTTTELFERVRNGAAAL